MDENPEQGYFLARPEGLKLNKGGLKSASVAHPLHTKKKDIIQSIYRGIF